MEKRKIWLTFLLITLISTPEYSIVLAQDKSPTDFYVGIQLAYGGVQEAKILIDAVNEFTNLLVVGTYKITYNESALSETFQYAHDKGLNFISFPPTVFWSGINSRAEWFDNATATWGHHLLGFYLNDEPGGKALDMPSHNSFNMPKDYNEAADELEATINNSLTQVRESFGYSNYPLFTSDYANYWFDYKGGYDCILAQFPSNLSRQMAIALCRGAATAHNKDWGIVVCWRYGHAPFIESGADLYEDLVLAYENGAKYTVVFDANLGYTQGILYDEHYNALKEFWHYIQNNKRPDTPLRDRVAFVLPKNYGCPFRGTGDPVWGTWPANNFSISLFETMNRALDKYGTKLDIIYDDGLETNNYYGYTKLINWNGTELSPSSLQAKTDLSTVLVLVGSAIGVAVIVASSLILYFKKKRCIDKSDISKFKR